MTAGQNGSSNGGGRPLWVAGLSPPDSWRSLRQPGNPQLHQVRHPQHRVWGHESKPEVSNFRLAKVSNFRLGLTVPPERTDDGETASPFLRAKVLVPEPPGSKMSRAEMYKHLLGQHGAKCQGCDRVFDDPRYLDLDHNTPRSDGWINHISNRILLCGPCNRLKSNTLTLSGLRKQNKKLGYMASGDGEHPLMREIREERENAPPTLFD